MKKIILLLIALIIGIVTVVWVNNKDSSTSIDDWEGSFAVKNVEEIHKIVIRSKKGGYVKLERSGRDWMINDEYKADPGKMENLLSAVKEINIQSVPPESSLKYVEDYILTDGYEVTYLDKKQSIIKNYMIGPATSNGDGIYYLMVGSRKPFIMEHGERYSDVSHMFTLKPQDYRDETVMDFAHNDIKSISVNYIDNKPESFIIDPSSEDLIKPLHAEIPQAPSQANRKLVEAYLREFTNRSAEGINSGIEYSDKIKKSHPFAEYSIVTQDDKAHNFVLIHYDNVHGDDDNYKKRTASERYYVVTENDIFTIQYDPFREIFRGYSYFFDDL